MLNSYLRNSHAFSNDGLEGKRFKKALLAMVPPIVFDGETKRAGAKILLFGKS